MYVKVLTSQRKFHFINTKKTFPICKWSSGIGELVTRYYRGTRQGDFFGDA